MQTNVDLSHFTTFGVGGTARYYVLAATPGELIQALELACENGWPYVVLAGGSNMLFPDAGYKGLVIHYLNTGAELAIGGTKIKVGASLPLASLVDGAIKVGLAGLEALSGIPGTVGGAIVGNAGAYGQSISDHLTRVEVFDMVSGVRHLSKGECEFAYRNSIFKKDRNLFVLRAEFGLGRGDGGALHQKSEEIIATREKKYPPTLKCPGSFFKNVLVKDVSSESLKLIDQSKIIDDKIPTGYLLEEVGAKDMRQGGAYVADYHSNLIINDGTASYKDVMTLSTELKKLVKDKFNITLEEEVRLC